MRQHVKSLLEAGAKLYAAFEMTENPTPGQREALAEYAKANNCVTCGERPRHLQYTECYQCRLPMHRAKGQKMWRTRKRMKRSREERNKQ